MAFTRTTASAAIGVNDGNITVASATGFAANYLIEVDNEWMQVRKDYVSGTTIPVLRGRNGSVTSAHAITSGVLVGLASDFANAPPQASAAVNGPLQRVRQVSSYGAAGAISLPAAGSDAVAIINGTAALAMTLAVPGKDNDGDILYIVGNGKAAHTVTVSGGLGAASTGYTVGTFDTLGQCCLVLIAANSVWTPAPSPMSGTLTAIDVAIA